MPPTAGKQTAFRQDDDAVDFRKLSGWASVGSATGKSAGKSRPAIGEHLPARRSSRDSPDTPMLTVEGCRCRVGFG